MDVKRILETIREVEAWTQRRDSLEGRMRLLPRSQRASMRAELEIVRQQLVHYQALLTDMKRSVAQPSFEKFIEHV
jgi:hypothetical protein